MFPDVNFLGLRVPLYTLAMVFSGLVVVVPGLWYNHTKGRHYPISLYLALWIMAPAMLFGRVMYYALNTCGFTEHSFWDLEYGGSMAVGATLGGIAGLFTYLWLKRIPPFEGLEVFIPYMPLGDAVGRLGCFAAGCCFGAPTGLPWGVRFPFNSLAFRREFRLGLIGLDSNSSLPVHPVQLYAAALAIVTFFVLKALLARKLRPGMMTFIYLFLYSFGRLGIDFFRADQPYVFLNLTVSQVVFSIMAPIAVMSILLLRRRTDRGNVGGSLPEVSDNG